MSASRIPFMKAVPHPIRRAFATADNPHSPDEHLEREIAARAVLDAIGITGETAPDDHDRAVRDARGWFKWGGSVEDLFDNAGLVIDNVRKIVLAIPVRYHQ